MLGQRNEHYIYYRELAQMDREHVRYMNHREPCSVHGPESMNSKENRHKYIEERHKHVLYLLHLPALLMSDILNVLIPYQVIADTG